MVIYQSYENQNFYPILYSILICIGFIFLSLILIYWDIKQGKKMLEEFPYDPEIQTKYSRYREGN